MLRKMVGFFIAIMLVVTVVWAAQRFYPSGTPGTGELGKDGQHWGSLYLKEQIIFEGDTNDAYEVTLDVGDPATDVTIRLPVTGSTAVMISTLATNDNGAANAVWGISNGLALEGATANAYETFITLEDPTADNTMTISDDTGSFAYTPRGTTTSAADSLAIPITHAHVAKTTGADAEALTLANGNPGQILTLELAVDGGGTGTLTPATASGFTTVVFADAGDYATFMYIDDTVGWVILGTAGVAAPPVISQ